MLMKTQVEHTKNSVDEALGETRGKIAAASRNEAVDRTCADAAQAPHAEAPARQERLWTGTFLLILSIALCVFMICQGVNSSTSVYIEMKGGPEAFSGFLAFIFAMSSAVTRLVVGPLIDRRSRRTIMLVGFAAFALGILGVPLNDSVPMFIFWRILQGAGFAAGTTAVSTAAADVLPLSRLGEGIGYYGLGQAVAMTVGPAIGLWLVGTDPAENVFFGMALVGAIGFALALACTYEKHIERLPESSAYYQRVMQKRKMQEEEARISRDAASAAREDSSSQKEPWWRAIIEPDALPGVLPVFFLTPTFGFSIYFCGLYGTVVGVGNAGLYYTLSAVTMIAVRFMGKPFMDKAGPIFSHSAAALCGAGALVLLLLAPRIPVLFYLAGLFYGVCMGLGMPVGQSVAVKNTLAHRWGAANALYQLAGDIGIGTSAIVWGAIDDAFGFSVSLSCALVLCLASIGVAYCMYPGHGLHPLEARAIGEAE